MNNINNILYHPAFLALGDMLLHSIWQISLIGLIVFLFLSSNRQLKPEFKADFLYGGMLIALLSSAVTFYYHFQLYNAASISGDPAEVGSTWISGFQKLSVSEGFWLAQWQHLDWIKIATIGWAIGMLIGAGKFASGMIGIFQFSRLQSVDPQSEVFACFRRVNGILQNRIPIKLKWSSTARAPFTFGFWSPVIVVPVSFMSGYNIDQIESILAHEMAHIRRRDYIHNLIQYVIESIFFFHPVMWFLAKELKTQREYACDEWVVRNGWNPFQYAVSLTKIQGHFLVAESGLTMNSRNAFLDFKRRIQRIVLKKEPMTSFRTQFLTGFSMLASFLIVIMYVHVKPQVETEVSLHADMSIEEQDIELRKLNAASRSIARISTPDHLCKDYVCFNLAGAGSRCFDLKSEKLRLKYLSEENKWFLSQNGVAALADYSENCGSIAKKCNKKSFTGKPEIIAAKPGAKSNLDDNSTVINEPVQPKMTQANLPKQPRIEESLEKIPEVTIYSITASEIADNPVDVAIKSTDRPLLGGSFVPVTRKRTGTSISSSPDAWAQWVNPEWAGPEAKAYNTAPNNTTIAQIGANFSLTSRLDKEAGLLIVTVSVHKAGIFGLRVMTKDNIVLHEWASKYLDPGDEHVMIDVSSRRLKSVMIQATCDTPAEKEERMLILNFSNVSFKTRAHTWIPEEQLYNSMPEPSTYIGQSSVIDEIELMLNNRTLVVATYDEQKNSMTYTQDSRLLVKLSDGMSGIWNITIPEAFRVNALLTQLKAG